MTEDTLRGHLHALRDSVGTARPFAAVSHRVYHTTCCTEPVQPCERSQTAEQQTTSRLVPFRLRTRPASVSRLTDDPSYPCVGE